MSKYTIVWNKNQSEGVIFKESDDYRSDVLHAAGSNKSNPVSTLADDFRENYDEHAGKKIQEVEIDEKQAVSVRTYRGKR